MKAMSDAFQLVVLIALIRFSMRVMYTTAKKYVYKMLPCVYTPKTSPKNEFINAVIISKETEDRYKRKISLNRL